MSGSGAGATSAIGKTNHRKLPTGWPEYGGVSAERFSAEKQINQNNVSKLQIAWQFHTHVFDLPSPSSNRRASFEATPVLFHDTLYFDTPFDQVFALDATTGKLRWSFDPLVDREKPIYIVTSRGVSLWHSKTPGKGVCEADTVFVATLDRRLIARDATTGASCSHFGVNGTVDLSKGVDVSNLEWYEFTSPPTVVGDMVVLGSTVADNQATVAASGAVRGFDARTGQQRWSWEPLRERKPYKAKATGSGNTWSVISADADHDLIFLPTGSASVDFWGQNREGDDRDADSLVALRASSGERIWGFQFVHHDLWDYDTPAEPVLFTFRGTIPAVAVATKTNMVFVFNRLTGTPLYPIVEKPVPPSTMPGEHAWPTQPFSTLPSLAPLSYTAADLHLQNPKDQQDCLARLKSIDNRGLYTPPSTNGTLNYPGGLGGANWGSSAFDPETGLLYTRVSTIPLFVRQTQRARLGDGFWDKLQWAWTRFKRKWRALLRRFHLDSPDSMEGRVVTPDSGGDLHAEDAEAGTPYSLTRIALESSNGVPCGPTPFGSIVALNVNTGQKVWSVAHGEMIAGEPGSVGAGGVVATGGGLLFAASTNDAFLRAYDSATGQELWKGILPVPANATPMTYSSRGKQFVVIADGGHGFIGKGQSDEMIAFALPAKTGKTH